MYPQFFATTNQNKLREVNEILGQSLEQISIETCEPQGLDVVEIVKIKAKDAYDQTGKVVLVEDTGLEFMAWDKLPGALIKWFLETVGNKGLLKMMSVYEDRRAIAKTAVGYFDGTECYVFIGEIQGSIPMTIRGETNFGWDPIFIPDGYDQSFAEMTKEEKNSISMRRLALEEMRKSFKS